MIGHVDADCFYVSAERVRFPHLCGMPVGVLGNQGACIIAKSYEAKAAGIKTGMPIWEAVPICPNGVYIKRDFEWYEVLSRQMLAIVHEISPHVEFYSIDESFFETSDSTGQAAQKLQQQILTDVGVPVSVGIAPSKTLAKLCSDSSKPFGTRVISTDSDRLDLLNNLPITEVTGIAHRTAKRLAVHGITTCDQFAAADRAFIRWLLTKRGEDIWWELNGTPVQKVLTARPNHKFVARGGSIGRASNNEARVTAFVVRNLERLVEALDHYKIVCDQIILSLSFKNARDRSGRVSLLGSTADFNQLRQAVLWLLPRVWQPQSLAVHYMHVIAGKLRPHVVRQRSLFEPSNDPRIAEVKTLINTTVGRFALRSGATTPLVDIYSDSASDYDICDVYGKSCF